MQTMTMHGFSGLVALIAKKGKQGMHWVLGALALAPDITMQSPSYPSRCYAYAVTRLYAHQFAGTMHKLGVMRCSFYPVALLAVL